MLCRTVPYLYSRFHLRLNIACCVRETVYVHLPKFTATESKATPSRTIPWGSVKLHAKDLLYASSHAKHGSSNASEIDCSSANRVRLPDL